MEMFPVLQLINVIEAGTVCSSSVNAQGRERDKNQSAGSFEFFETVVIQQSGIYEKNSFFQALSLHITHISRCFNKFFKVPQFQSSSFAMFFNSIQIKIHLRNSCKLSET